MARLWLVFGLTLLLGACQHAPERPSHTVAQVDLERFMGSWFVIAHIPLWPERNAWNAVEHYRLVEPDRVLTTFTFREGGKNGERKRYTPTALVTDDASNAIWGMRFLWPFRADFRVVWLDDDYQQTIIGRKKRDYAWIMARQPAIGEADYRAMVEYLKKQGYPVEKLRRVPQQWQGEPGYSDLQP